MVGAACLGVFRIKGLNNGAKHGLCIAIVVLSAIFWIWLASLLIPQRRY